MAYRWLSALMAVVVITFGLAAAQADATPSVDIQSAGPLTDIVVGNDLSCQVGHVQTTSYEFFSPDSAPASCGTFVLEGGTSPALFGPEVGLGPSVTAWAPVSQSGVTGAGTAASPWTVTTVVNDGLTPAITVTETDAYVAGEDFYTTQFTVTNGRTSTFSGFLYHGADCFLRGFDTGYGALLNSDAPACTINPNNSPASALEAFVPLTVGDSWVETGFASNWADIGAVTDTSQPPLPNTVDAATQEDNGMAIAWPVSVPGSSSRTFAMQTLIQDPVISATGGHAFTGATTNSGPATISGTLATISDSDLSTSPSDYSVTIDWGDGSGPDLSADVEGANGSFTVSDSHAYASPGHYAITVTVAYAANAANAASAIDSATIAAPPPAVIPAAPTVGGSTSAGLSGSVDPNGLGTQARFEYGLDPKYAGGGPVVYDQSTPTQTIAGDFASHPVSATVTGLVPNATYHFRLVATNSAGTTTGPDQTFTTRKDPAPPAPVIGQSFNAGPVKGLVLIKLPAGAHISAAPRGFVKGKSYFPLTEARRLPIGTKIDARRGTLTLTTASFKIGKTQSATLSGGLFKLASQTRKGLNKGLANVALIENDFPGAPSFAACKPAKASQAANPAATEAKLSAKVLQTLHASDNHGRFTTTGKHSAATVRGTVWDTTERCDGTLTTVHRGTVSIRDFGLRKTITLHAGHHYLARANAKPPKKKK